MPINTTHKDYEAHIAKVTRARDACAGQDAIHAKGETYLPRIDGWDDKKYRNFLKRTTYYNATGRTLDGLVGMIMKKDPVIEQRGLDDIINDVDLHGNKLASVIQMILRDVLIASRIGLLVEYPEVNEEARPRSQAEQAQQNLRPYVSVYKTESIINWGYKRINNVMQPVFIVLEESYIDDDSDKYAPKYKTQYRELLLEDNIYKQRIYRQVDDKGDFVLAKETIPKINSKAINFIPMYAFGSDTNSLEITDSPILDLVNTNLAHYMVSGDYEHGCHVSGLPTLTVSGIQTEDEVSVGGAIVSPDPNMKAAYVEVMSKFEALLNNLQEKKKEMATLGARMLEQQKNAVESEGAMQMRAHGENSVLGAIAKLVGDQLANMLMFMAEWAGIGNRDVNVTLNTDFMPVGMTAQDLLAHVTAWQSGAISDETLFYNLKRGEVIADDVDYEEEKERIGNQPPILATE